MTVLAGARAGLAMVAASQEVQPDWQVRVGLHFGPVVAGVVGRRKFMFNLWGDTVNVASRISDQAEPGTIFLSGDAWAQIRTSASGQSRGMVPLKGKGEMELVEVTAVD
ncbi:MAG: adenylate/guanylate cyclase domain-containing protein [Rhodospirillaceae bacterium]|nr:adenylate/guanylate cyclase domain-containing protein [Rhodospirillaceae bacterium]MBT5944461.1 adenylate/guanylate cyclase domain-containing protein [Rhodospirillaceae bacterium]MBT6537457.1 adenylate/guanylate cyclase domain-containing protein [Rhodospirillaceae bacterium]